MSDHCITAEVSKEIWREIPGYPAYEVSDQGLVRRRYSENRWVAGHVLRRASMPSGHRYVLLATPPGARASSSCTGLWLRPSLVRLLSLAQWCCITTGGGTPANLYWGTYAENVADARLNRRPRDGQRNRHARPGRITRRLFSAGSGTPDQGHARTRPVRCLHRSSPRRAQGDDLCHREGTDMGPRNR